MSRTRVKPAEPAATPPPKPGSQDALRETFESIVVAFVLAFLFRTFIAEAFVIPTGSMAPTLFGRHKDVQCPQCGQHYEVGASEELDDDGVRLVRRISSARCPNCRYIANIKNLNAFKGDRILVNKFPYEVGEPQRFDVCVFKFPEIPERNYIKRMIGLPGETIRLNRGDVYARRRGESSFEILRKSDPNKQNAIQVLVYDDAHPPRALLEKGWPERWSGMRRDGDGAAGDGWSPHPEDWSADPRTRVYSVDATDEWRWLRYRHFVPTKLDWDSVNEGLPPTPNPRPQLISDYYGYNTFSYEGNDEDLFWVGDLTVSGVLEIQQVDGDAAAVRLELVEGARRYWCEFDVKSGQATLAHNDDLNPEGPAIQLGAAATPVKGPGRFRFTFANVDDRLCLWINDRLISFGDKAAYQPAVVRDPQVADLTPVGLGVRGARAQVSHLLLRRDLYYRAERVADDAHGPDKLGDGEDLNSFVRNQLREALSDPQEYARIYNEKASPIEFGELRDGEFFVMGDNSPRSQDSRLWSNRRGAYNRHAVPRNAMVGKAFLIYWPHGIPFGNGGQGYPILYHTVANQGVQNYPLYTFPFYPQFDRWFKRIR